MKYVWLLPVVVPLVLVSVTVYPLIGVAACVLVVIANCLTSKPAKPQEDDPPKITPFRGATLNLNSDKCPGPKVTSQDSEFPADYPGLYLLGQYLPASAASNHFMFCGSSGSGKSLTMDMLLHRSILPLIRKGSKHRLVKLDVKTDQLSKLFHAVDPQVPIRIFHPIDSRCVRWELGMDYETPALAYQLAWMLIPKLKEETQPYFRDTARLLLFALILVLQHYAPGRWTLRHLILGMKTRQRLSELLRLLPMTADLVTQFLGTAKTGREIIASAGSCLNQLEIVAACWDHARSGFSVRQFLQTEGVVVLGHNDTIQHALEIINRMLLRRICEESLARQKGTEFGRTWLELDEAPILGNCDFIAQVAMRGRSSGISMLLSCQSVESFYASYGSDKAHELFGSLLTKILFRCESEATCKFASSMIGNSEDIVTTHSFSHTCGTSKSYENNQNGFFRGVNQPYSSRSENESYTTGRNQSLQVRPLIMPDEFRRFPLPSEANNRVTGAVNSPSTGAFLGTSPFLEHVRGQQDAIGFPNFLPRPASHQRLSPWCVSDLEFLNLPVTPRLLATIRHRPIRETTEG